MSPPLRITRRPAAEGGPWTDSVLPLLRRIYTARGAHDASLAQPKLAQLLPPDALSGIGAAVALLASAIAAGKRILVVGDFDCDGATACAVAVRGLRLLGAAQVLHAVPNRMVHGYGLSPALVAELAPLQPDLLVTVDHGIACHAGVAAAKALGWQVLVTDHHLPGSVLPPADAIVDPNLVGDAFPSKMLAGVGVIFYVLLALRRHLRERGTFATQAPDLTVLLDLVAVGTVADLVPLDTNNRALVSAGLRRLQRGDGCIGLRALIEASGRDPARLSASDIGFALAPRLNAAGRLEDMALGIELLLCEDPQQARAIAATLEQINGERRAVQQQMTDEAEATVAQALLAAPDAPPVAVCLFDADWHPGVIGLVASKMKDRLHRPVIAFAPAEPGSDQLRGSARSIPGFHIRDAMAAVDARRPGLMDKFGGHAMAAGLSLPHAALAEFEQLFCAHALASLDAALLQAELLSDGALDPHELDHRHAEALRLAGPWGQGFPEPLFDGEFEVLQWRLLKERHLKLSLRCAGRGEPLNAIHFNGWRGDEPGRRVHIAYRLVADDYRGGDAVQLVVEHWRSLSG
ncbi:single-stranded-DNA-specific exonuclease RecJ [Xanthomonas translucens]|uniref:Single-stranded-DNA-specific exonuclease RecJ n=1 Tax=Xanthomonas translucens pv. translucens DSM 18974 TaxID=1261556 RepID=A0A1C3TP04_XANCT|nr:single-stranded-DNA-specific exonuclease RecJ [Xanthomonas translucens]MCC8448671.1 single-stranded-DNA-specific exonuclease RecJ [Xanthomonas translucens pv. translucens]MCT8287573.1 single-stranded-DNA-specific exonuclease RecJ [Xanthomonas translucens pv. translucens]MCT8305231.1 single-stranded-DNA-specific exonuclease RecJ [Xanthomonas translucens pv. translucens]UNU00001.1 single-stranded-DNA-specific exonuclease RecJ [Xanthomonas translucens pv. translucens]CCP38587.1 single-stranded